MEFDVTWLLLSLPLAFTLGWLASRFDLRQLRIENRQAPKAYFRGLNFLLNEQQDQAIDAFIEAVQNDPETSELHFALGNLFRRRGEYERAVRVHEHLMSRGDLTQIERNRAQHALALDFLKAGLLDRAEAALLKLEGTAYQDEARLALLAIYERSRDWEHATQIASKLDGAGRGSFDSRQAHYLCEQAGACVAAGDAALAVEKLAQACRLAPSSPRPLLDLAKLQHQSGQQAAALQTLQQLNSHSPHSVPLAAGLLSNIAQQSDLRSAVTDLLLGHYRQQPSIDVLEAMVKLDDAQAQSPARGYLEHLRHEPSLIAAARWIAAERLGNDEAEQLVARALDRATKPLMRYRCAACGFEASQHFWHCPGCQAWDSYPAKRIEEL